MVLDYENLYLSRARFLMRLLGVWVPSDEESLLQKLHRAIMLTLQYLFLLFQIIYMFQVWGDMEAVSEILYVLFTQAYLCFKVSVFLANKNIQKELLKQMNSTVFRAQSDVQEKILKDHATRIQRLLMAFMIGTQFVCGTWALKPLFDDPGTRKFPFDMWMPVSPGRSPQYQLGFAFQLLTILMSAYMYFGVDSFAMCSTIFCCAQIDIIKDKILSIKTLSDKKGNELTKTSSYNYNKLVECIQHHQAVVAFKKLVEDANHAHFAFQLTGSIGLFCVSALRILTVEWKSMQFVAILMYLTVMISQLFVCCWCGNQLTATSGELHTVLYQCIWYEQSLNFQKVLAFTMKCMQRPLILRAGHYIPLLRQTFVSILRMSYSYFAVLNTAQNN